MKRLLPYLACSPDGLVGDDTVIEVKCPFTARNSAVTSESVPYLKENSNGLYYLDSAHEYFFQVQGLLFCCDRQLCDFVVWTHRDLKCVQVKRDDVFITNMILKLTNFFDSYFRPAVINKFFYRNT